MTLRKSCARFNRVWIVAAVAGLSVSCSQVKVQSPLDYVGPARGAAATQPGAVKIPGATQPALAIPGEAVPAILGMTGATSRPVSDQVQAAASQPLSIGVTDAVLLSLEQNQGFIVERYRPKISRTAVESERAAFDPDLTAQLTSSHRKSRSPTTQPHKTIQSLGESLAGQIGVTEFLPTGTSVSVTGSTDLSFPGTKAFDDFYVSRLGVNVNQPLLRGFGLNVNLASLHQAQIDVKFSQYELRGFAESLVATVQETYWDYALAQQQIAIVTQSLELAQQQLNETSERIRIGKLAETELAAAQSEVAVRQEDLINARSNLAKTGVTLIRLLNTGGPARWDRDIVLQTMPTVPEVDLGNVEEHVAVAMRMRPDLNQARLLVQRNELDVVKTKNGLLPRMDLFVNVGRSGYADSFGGSMHGADGLGYDVQFGGVVEYPPLNRAARAAYTRSILSRDQQMDILRNTEQLAQVDIRSAFIEVMRAREQVTATAATRKLQEEKLRAETEKFRVGKSTSLLVAAASRDLLVSQLAEVQAIVTNLRALIELYRLEGTLLVRMGIQAPGFEPTTLASK
jgi:outer membrane protein